jgi:hypothetical protein
MGLAGEKQPLSNSTRQKKMLFPASKIKNVRNLINCSG